MNSIGNQRVHQTREYSFVALGTLPKTCFNITDIIYVAANALKTQFCLHPRQLNIERGKEIKNVGDSFQ